MRKTTSQRCGLEQGQSAGAKIHFTLAETARLSVHLKQRRHWHDLALLTVGLDTLLRSGDLLKLTVADVTYSKVRHKLNIKQQKTANAVEPSLTPTTQKHLAQWIGLSGKQRQHHLFTRSQSLAAWQAPFREAVYILW